jgi:dihydrodipicolinate synthase/N-acetylneuraminate lyase
MDLKGVVGLLPTPLTEGGTIDEVSLRRLIDYNVENGCDGVGVLAAIGEGYLFSDAEWNAVVRITADHLRGKIPFIVGCAAMGTTRALELGKRAEDLGATAILAFNPQSFKKYSTQELIDHYIILTDGLGISVVPYARLDDPIPFDVIATLISEKRIKHMKNGWHDCQYVKDLAESFKEKLLIFCGADTYTLRYLLLGCSGILTATVAVWPNENVTLFKMVNKGEIDAARHYYAEKLLTWNDIGFYENWQAVHKLALQSMGIIKTAVCLPPLAQALPHQVEEVKWALRHSRKA